MKDKEKSEANFSYCQFTSAYLPVLIPEPLFKFNLRAVEVTTGVQ